MKERLLCPHLKPWSGRSTAVSSACVATCQTIQSLHSNSVAVGVVHGRLRLQTGRSYCGVVLFCTQTNIAECVRRALSRTARDGDINRWAQGKHHDHFSSHDLCVLRQAVLGALGSRDARYVVSHAAAVAQPAGSLLQERRASRQH